MTALRTVMSRTRAIAASMLVLSAALAAAQSAGPCAAYVFPAGGRRGTTFTATVAGQDLRNPLGAEVSGGGVSVRVLSYAGKAGLLTKVQEEELKRRLQELAGVRAAADTRPAADAGPAVRDPAAKVELPDLPELRNLDSKTRAQLKLVADQFLNRDKRPKPPMDELVTLEITLAGDAAPGDRALRLRTRNGLTNPLVFQVGTEPEAREPGRFAEAPAESPLLALPSVLNGQIFPGEVDRIRLGLKAGEAVDLSTEARSLIPYLADAVPGWFQAVLSVSGPDGDEVAWCDDDGLDPDPRLSFRAPTDGVYTIAIRDSIYRGREDFVYRLRISAGGGGPAAPVAAPMVAIAGQRSAVVTVPFPSKVRGVLARSGSIEAYEFTAPAGETVVAEVRARRDGSPLDSFLRLRDAAGKIIASNDDAEDKEYGLLTAHADSYLRVKLPAAGAYRLELLDTTGKGGGAWAYTLDIRRPAPDFAVLTTLSALNLAPTGSAAFSVVAIRRDGWEGDITLRLRRPERAFSLEGGLIPAGRERMQMTLTGRKRGSEEAVQVELEAAAVIGGVEVVRPVKPADLRMQAFGNTHLVQAEALWVCTRRNAAAQLIPSPAPPLTLAPGGSVELTFRYPPLPVKSFKVELVNPPTGITLKDQKASQDSLVLVFAADQSVKAGTENLVLSLRGEPSDAQARAGEVDLGVLPAIVVNVVGKAP